MDKRLSLALGLLAAAGFAAAVWHQPRREPPPITFRETTPAPKRSHRAELVVYVAGAVKAPGVYSVPDGSRAVAAVKAAGGPLAAADLGAVNLAAPLDDGEEVLVPDRSRESAAPRAQSKPRNHRNRHGRAKHHRAAEITSGPVDLNSAGAEELAAVPGLGAGLAARIVAFRDVNGPFARIEDLLDVGGMSAARLDRVQPYLEVR